MLEILIKISHPSLSLKTIKQIVKDYNQAPSASELNTLIEEALYVQ